MRVARIFVPIVTMAFTAIAFATSSASAQSLEFTTQHCSPVTLTGHSVAGGCEIHAASEGEITLRQHIFGIESQVSVCENEFTGRLDEDAEGYITEQVLSDHGACNREPCDEETAPKEKRPWHVTGREEELHAGYPETLRASFCVETPTNTTRPQGETTCLVDVPFRDDEASGLQEFGEPPPTEMPGTGTAGFRCELIGHWMTEVEQAGEVNVETHHPEAL